MYWSGTESVFGPERLPPREFGLLDLVRDQRHEHRRAVKPDPPYILASSFNQGTNGPLSAAESDFSIVPTASASHSGGLPCDRDWEVLSLCSEWDRCSVRNLQGSGFRPHSTVVTLTHNSRNFRDPVGK